MKFTSTILSVEEQERVHRQALRILAEVGVRFHGQRALPLLEKHGARVDADARVARFPQELVEQALQAAPEAFVLGARNSEHSYPLPSPVPRYAIDGTSAFARDFETGQRRYGTRKDIEQALRVFQGLDMGVMAWAPTTASDAPAGSRVLHEFVGMVQHCSKHGQHEIHHPRQVPYLVSALVAVAGDEATLRATHNWSLIYCPVAPLVHDGDMLDAYLELGNWDLPVMVMPMPVTGTTGPASLFSNIALAVAEALSAIIVYELAHPGRPVIFSSATGSVDFRTGGYLAGTPEMGLQSAALVSMGRYYGLPSGSAGCSSDAKEPGPQAVLDKLITTIAPVCAGADIIVGMGEIEGDQQLILEQLVVDNEIAHFCQRLRDGVDSTEAKDLFDDVARVGPGGHFLGSAHTRRAARSDEFFMSQLLDRHSYEAWAELGRPGMYSRAREKVQEVLSAPPVDPLPSTVTARLNDILRSADKDLA